MISTAQVKSKKRVADHGEVFTAAREVNAMLDLVQQETERIDSRFLEPACGTGNFLVEILRRKLRVVESRYAKNQLEFERYAVSAVFSLYGIDILQDNVQECQKNLFTVFDELYTRLYKKHGKPACRKTMRFVLNRNVLWGNTLSLHTPAEQPQPIVFSEWSFVQGSFVKRRDYAFASLVQADGQNNAPSPIQEFPLTHFLQLADDCNNKLQPGRTYLPGQPEQRRGVHAAPLGEPNAGYAAHGTLEQQRREVSRSGM